MISPRFGRTSRPQIAGISCPTDISRDLIAGALADANLAGAIQLLEQEQSTRLFQLNDLFLLIYLYCVNGDVDKAEGSPRPGSQYRFAKIGSWTGFGEIYRPNSVFVRRLVRSGDSQTLSRSYSSIKYRSVIPAM